MFTKQARNVFFLAVMMVFALAAAAAPGRAAAGDADLSAVYKLAFSIEDGTLNEQFSVTADAQGLVALAYPFISGGCINVNELQVQAIKYDNNDVKIVDLLWNCDRGRPCKAFLPVRLQASLQLPEPGKYLIRLWAQEPGDGEKTSLAGQQEIEWK